MNIQSIKEILRLENHKFTVSAKMESKNIITLNVEAKYSGLVITNYPALNTRENIEVLNEAFRNDGIII